MAENLSKRPAKGILKASSSFDHAEANKNNPDIKWDEMNILQTLHPPDKDYGHMKIEEPKTPYSYYNDGTEVSSHGCDAVDASLLAEKIELSSEEAPKSLRSSNSDDEDDDDEYADETEEERAQRKAFEHKRKMHYNEYYAVKLARRLIAKDDDGDEEEEEKEDGGEGVEKENGSDNGLDDKK